MGNAVIDAITSDALVNLAHDAIAIGPDNLHLVVDQIDDALLLGSACIVPAQSLGIAALHGVIGHIGNGRTPVDPFLNVEGELHLYHEGSGLTEPVIFPPDLVMGFRRQALAHSPALAIANLDAQSRIFGCQLPDLLKAPLSYFFEHLDVLRAVRRGDDFAFTNAACLFRHDLPPRVDVPRPPAASNVAFARAMVYEAAMDAETLRKIAELARSRANPPRNVDKRDGLMRLGAQRALEQFATDLEIMAQHCR